MQQATHYLLPEKLKTLSNELFLCVCCFSPKRVSFSKNFGEEDPIAISPFSFKTPGPWEPGALYIWGLRWMLKGLQVREGSGWSFFSMSFNRMFLMKFSFGFKTWLKWLKLTNIWGGNADFLKMPFFWLSFHPMCLSMNSIFLLPPQNHNFFLPRFSSSIILSCF